MAEPTPAPPAQRAARLCLVLGVFAMAAQAGTYFVGRDPANVPVTTLNLLFYAGIGCIVIGVLAGALALKGAARHRGLNIRTLAMTGLCVHVLLAGNVVWAFVNGAGAPSNPAQDKRDEALLVGLWRGDYVGELTSEPVTLRFDADHGFRLFVTGLHRVDLEGNWRVDRGVLHLEVESVNGRAHNAEVGDKKPWFFQKIGDDHVRLNGRDYRRITSVTPETPATTGPAP